MTRIRRARIKARIKARTPEEFERWRRLADKVRQKKAQNTNTTTEVKR